MKGTEQTGSAPWIWKRALDRLAAVSGLAGMVLAGLALASLFLLVVLEVVLRQLFSTSTLFSTEVSGYLLVACVFLGLANTFLENGFIRVDIVYEKLTPRVRRWFDAAIAAMSLFAMLIFSGYSWAFAIDRLGTGETSVTVMRTPLWIPQMCIPIGATLLTLALVAVTGRALLALRGGASEEPPTGRQAPGNNPADWL